MLARRVLGERAYGRVCLPEVCVIAKAEDVCAEVGRADGSRLCGLVLGEGVST